MLETKKIQSKNLTISCSIGVVILVGLSCTAAVVLYNAELPQIIHTSNVSNSASPSIDINERTLLILKPDTIQRGLIGKVLQRLENKGFKLVGIKFVQASKEQIESHYELSVGRDYFPRLLDFMTSSPIIVTVWEGLNAVKIGRQMIGPSDPIGSMAGTIRADFSIDRLRNIVHGAESVEDANREIKLWFQDHELIEWTPANIQFLYGSL